MGHTESKHEKSLNIGLLGSDQDKLSVITIVKKLLPENKIGNYILNISPAKIGDTVNFLMIVDSSNNKESASWNSIDTFLKSINKKIPRIVLIDESTVDAFNQKRTKIMNISNIPEAHIMHFHMGPEPIATQLFENHMRISLIPKLIPKIHKTYTI